MDDRDCLVRLTGGGKPAQQALTTLYDRYARRFHGYLRGRGFSHEESEEIVQDTFMRLARLAGRDFTVPDAPGAWLYTLLNHSAVDHLRKQRPEEIRATDLLGADEDDDLAQPGDRVAGHIAPEAFWDCALRALTAFRQRHPEPGEALILVILEGWDLRQLARYLGKRDGATREYVSHWRRRLREFLEQFCQEHLVGGDLHD